MSLAAYLEKKELRPQDFAAKIGVSRHAVERYLNGRVPKPDILARIVSETGGEVQPGDFYDLPAPRRRRKRSRRKAG